MKENLLILYNANYKVNDNYNLVYLTQDSYEILLEALSNLRRSGEFDGHTYTVMKNMFRHYYKNSIKIKELDSIQPRNIAQKFIGKKKIRTFIFNRDGNICLKCGINSNLQIDHIVPISKGGENKLSNLQTLCQSCNSSKSNKFKDYRYGSR